MSVSVHAASMWERHNPDSSYHTHSLQWQINNLWPYLVSQSYSPDWDAAPHVVNGHDSVFMWHSWLMRGVPDSQNIVCECKSAGRLSVSSTTSSTVCQCCRSLSLEISLLHGLSGCILLPVIEREVKKRQTPPQDRFWALLEQCSCSVADAECLWFIKRQ